jgi:hypothetical protein
MIVSIVYPKIFAILYNNGSCVRLFLDEMGEILSHLPKQLFVYAADAPPDVVEMARLRLVGLQQRRYHA